MSSHFFLSLVKGLLILLIISKKQILVSLIFFIDFLFLFSALIFICLLLVIWNLICSYITYILLHRSKKVPLILTCYQFLLVCFLFATYKHLPQSSVLKRISINVHWIFKKSIRGDNWSNYRHRWSSSLRQNKRKQKIF